MNSQIAKKPFLPLLTRCAGVLLISCVAVSTAQAERLKSIRIIDTGDLFSQDFFIGDTPPDLTGVAFPPKAQTLILLNQPKGKASVVLVAPAKKGEALRAPVEIPDSINIAFDPVSESAKGFNVSRLFLLDNELDELIVIKSKVRNVMNSSKIKRFETKEFGIVDPQGMTLDPVTGQLFVLDSSGPRLIGIQPRRDRDYSDVDITPITLGGLSGKLRGIAFNPTDNHLYLLSTEQQKLYKLTLDGELVTTIDFSGQQVEVPYGMIFAPSLDPTDPPSIFNLYLVSDKGPNGQATEWALQ